MDEWIDSLTDGWVLVGHLSNFPPTLSSLQLCGENINLVGPSTNDGAAGTDLGDCCLLLDIFKYLLPRLKSAQLSI